jgi:outer membrane protein
MKRPHAARLGLLVAAGLAAAGAQAADQPLWELGLGAAWVHLPHYRGSDQSRDWLLPVPYAVYRGEILRANRDGARAVLLDSERFDFDISVSAAAPTRSSDNLARSGMADLAPVVEIGPNLNSTLARGAGWKLDLRFPVHAVFTVQSKPQSIGWTASPVINLDLQWAGWNLGVQGGPRWASRRYHGFYYDVGTADATAVRPAYAAQGWLCRLAADGRRVAAPGRLLARRLRARRWCGGRGVRRQPADSATPQPHLRPGAELGVPHFG